MVQANLVLRESCGKGGDTSPKRQRGGHKPQAPARGTQAPSPSAGDTSPQAPLGLVGWPPPRWRLGLVFPGDAQGGVPPPMRSQLKEFVHYLVHSISGCFTVNIAVYKLLKLTRMGGRHSPRAAHLGLVSPPFPQLSRRTANLRPSNDGVPWTREQAILAFELYCRIPFQQTKATNPRVGELAAIIGRTPASVARKLGNFGAFDPELARRNISGLAHGSKLDRQIWDEFHRDWSGLITEASEIQRRIGAESVATTALAVPESPSERLVTATQRLHHAFFREAVLSSYDGRCCITGLPIPQCLVAGHIIPWSVDERRRADPTNGLCLAATFERLFDCGLIAVDHELRLVVSPSLHGMRDESVRREVLEREGRSILTPHRFPPSPVCLEWHRQHVFQSGP